MLTQTQRSYMYGWIFYIRSRASCKHFQSNKKNFIKWRWHDLAWIIFVYVHITQHWATPLQREIPFENWKSTISVNLMNILGKWFISRRLAISGKTINFILLVILLVMLKKYMGAIWKACVDMGVHMSCYGWALVGIGRCWWVWYEYGYKFEGNVGLS